MFYSACIPAIFGNLPIEESLAHVREAGLRHYEFWGWDLSQIDAYAAAQSRYGLTPAALCTTVHDLTDPSRRDAYLQGLRETLPVCQKLGCRIIISQVGPELSHLSRQAQHESITAGFRAAAPLLEKAGVTLVFEPLNTRVDHVGYYLWRAEEAFQIVREVGSPNVKVLLDLYHQYVMDDLNLSQILTNLDKIGHFHLAGFPGRHEPLEHPNTEDYPTILSALRQAGYVGGIGLEYFPTRPAAQQLADLCRDLSAC